MNKDTIHEIFIDYCCKRILLDLYQLKTFTLKNFKENSPFFGARDKLLRLGIITVNNDEMLKLTPAGETMMATKEYFEKLQTDTAKKYESQIKAFKRTIAESHLNSIGLSLKDF